MLVLSVRMQNLKEDTKVVEVRQQDSNEGNTAEWQDGIGRKRDQMHFTGM